MWFTLGFAQLCGVAFAKDRWLSCPSENNLVGFNLQYAGNLKKCVRKKA